MSYWDDVDFILGTAFSSRFEGGVETLQSNNKTEANFNGDGNVTRDLTDSKTEWQFSLRPQNSHSRSGSYGSLNSLLALPGFEDLQEQKTSAPAKPSEPTTTVQETTPAGNGINLEDDEYFWSMEDKVDYRLIPRREEPELRVVTFNEPSGRVTTLPSNERVDGSRLDGTSSTRVSSLSISSPDDSDTDSYFTRFKNRERSLEDDIDYYGLLSSPFGTVVNRESVPKNTADDVVAAPNITMADSAVVAQPPTTSPITSKNRLLFIPQPPKVTKNADEKQRYTRASSKTVSSGSLPGSVEGGEEEEGTRSNPSVPSTSPSKEARPKGGRARVKKILLVGPDEADGRALESFDNRREQSASSFSEDLFSEIVNKNGVLATGRFDSCTLGVAAHQLVSGMNVGFFSIHSVSKQPVHTAQMWGDTLLPSFFRHLFQSANETMDSVSVELSIVLVKQDMCRDMLGDFGSFQPLVVSGFPVLGVRTSEGCFTPVKHPAAVTSLVGRALSSLSSDDYTKGCIISVINVKRVVFDEATKTVKDTILSSFFDASASPLFLHNTLLHQLYPKSVELFRCLFGKPIQLHFCVHSKKMTDVEKEMTNDLIQYFDQCTTPAPYTGSLTGLLGYMKEVAQKLHTKLNEVSGVMEAHRLEWRKRPERGDDWGSKDEQRLSEHRSTMYALYRQDKVQLKRLKLSLRSLDQMSRDCKTLLKEGGSSGFPPSYLATTCHLNQRFFTDPKEAERVEGGVFAGQLGKGKSEISNESVINGKKKKRYPFPYRRSATPLCVFDVWKCKVPALNSFAGDYACPLKGIPPAFPSEGKMNQFFLMNGAKERKIESVVFVEDPEVDTQTNQVPETEMTVEEGENSLLVNSVSSSGEKKPFTADEVIKRKRWSSTHAMSPSARSHSTKLKEYLEAFQAGYNVHVMSMTGGGPQTCSMLRLLRSPVWLALREMVDSILHEAESVDGPSKVGLYLSIVQVLSRDFVRDHFRGKGHSPGDSPSSVGNSVTSSSELPALPFKSSWTPCGPVVEGARYIKINTVGQFWKLLRDLPACVQNTNTEQTHLLISFLFSQSQVTELGSVQSGSTLSPSFQPVDPKCHFCSLSIKMTTDVQLFNALLVDDFVTPSHPRNLFNFIYCDRVISTVDIVADEASEALFFLNGQKALLNSIRGPVYHAPWNMNHYVSYLSLYVDALHATMKTIHDEATVDDTSKSYPFYPPSSLLQPSPSPFPTKGASLTEVAEVWRQANRMLSLALAVCRGKGGDLTPFALSLDSGQAYHITSPPSGFSKQIPDERESGESQSADDSHYSNPFLSGTKEGTGLHPTSDAAGASGDGKRHNSWHSAPLPLSPGSGSHRSPGSQKRTSVNTLLHTSGTTLPPLPTALQ